MPLGVSLENIEIGEANITSSKSIKFLGVTLQTNGKFDMMVSEKVAKIRKLAWMLRSLWIINKKKNELLSTSRWCTAKSSTTPKYTYTFYRVVS